MKPNEAHPLGQCMSDDGAGEYLSCVLASRIKREDWKIISEMKIRIRTWKKTKRREVLWVEKQKSITSASLKAANSIKVHVLHSIRCLFQRALATSHASNESITSGHSPALPSPSPSRQFLVDFRLQERTENALESNEHNCRHSTAGVIFGFAFSWRSTSANH